MNTGTLVKVYIACFRGLCACVTQLLDTHSPTGSIAASSPNISAASLLTSSSKTGPTLFRLTPAAAGLSATGTQHLGMGSDQFALTPTGQAPSVTIPQACVPSVGSGNMATTFTTGGNAIQQQQKIVVMSSSPAGQVQVVPQQQSLVPPSTQR